MVTYFKGVIVIFLNKYRYQVREWLIFSDIHLHWALNNRDSMDICISVIKVNLFNV